jgi:transposase
VATQDDATLDLPEIEELLRRVVQGIGQAPNRVRKTMNGFLIAVGTHVQPLLAQAKKSAQDIGPVAVDVGDTACKVPDAIAYIEKAEKAGTVGEKRKTLRC